MNTTPYIGIDFGTTKSVVTYYDPDRNRPDIIRNYESEEQTPSVVYYGETEVLVGTPALNERKNRGWEGQSRYISSVKRNLAKAPTRIISGVPVTPVMVVSEIFSKLKRDAEAGQFEGQPVSRVVITYPASFGPTQQGKIVEAATKAGFTEIQLLEEPVAAAKAYAHMGVKVDNYILVYDLGGGTFDLALLKRDATGLFYVAMKPDGLEDCGGDDLDRELYMYSDEKAQELLGRKISPTNEIDLEFLDGCRLRKESLSLREQSKFEYLLLPDKRRFEYTIVRAEFEKRISSHIDRTVNLTKKMLARANEKHYTVETLLLVGGSSKVPLVNRMLADNLAVKLQEWHQRNYAVAYGAACYAHELWGSENGLRLPKKSPSDEYSDAVKSEWVNKKLTQEQVASLNTKASQLRLSADAVARIERVILGGATKEEMLAYQNQQEYRTAVIAVWNHYQFSKKLTQEQVNSLSNLSNQLHLSNSSVAMIERAILDGKTKEEILKQQNLVILTETGTLSPPLSKGIVPEVPKREVEKPVPVTPVKNNAWKLSFWKICAVFLFVGCLYDVVAIPGSAWAFIIVALLCVWGFFRKNTVKKL